MTHRFSRDFIDSLLAKVDIVELIDHRVTLKKSGNNYAACCPFHTEKTPSFTVSPQKQFYHCFGCSAHGNAIGFLMAYDRLEFADAIEELANITGVPIPQETITASYKPQVPYYQLLEQVTNYYHSQLKRSPKASYYLNKRGLSSEIISRFRIGYAPGGWTHLLQQFGKSSSVETQLIETGMVIRSKEGKLFDRFHDRIMIPIRNSKGQIIGFGGRSLGVETPKYLNSPETVLFHKGRELYGLYELKQSHQKIESILVVEGYMDVIALQQYGIAQVVATLGTATTAQHLQHLFRLAPEIIFCFDGDSAGQQAAWRALETCLPNLRDGLQIRFMFLPNNEDPDSLIRKQGLNGFKQYMAQATALADFFFARLSAQTNLNNLDGKAKLAKFGRDYLNKIRNGVFQELMLEKLASLVGTSSATLNTIRLNEIPLRTVATPNSSQPKIVSPIQLAIALILQSPGIVQETLIPEKLSNIKLPGVPTLQKLLELLKANPQLSCGHLLEYFRGHKVATQLAKLAVVELLIPPSAEQLGSALHKIIQLQQEAQIQQLLNKGNHEGNLSIQEKEILRNLLKERHTQ